MLFSRNMWSQEFISFVVDVYTKRQFDNEKYQELTDNEKVGSYCFIIEESILLNFPRQFNIDNVALAKHIMTHPSTRKVLNVLDNDTLIMASLELVNNGMRLSPNPLYELGIRCQEDYGFVSQKLQDVLSRSGLPYQLVPITCPIVAEDYHQMDRLTVENRRPVTILINPICSSCGCRDEEEEEDE